MLSTPLFGQENSPTQKSSHFKDIQPGDKIKLRIWREDALSGEFVVNESGIVVLPKVGKIPVSDLTPDSLSNILTQKYSSSLRSPSIEVTLLRRVNVLGAVRSPGLFYVDMTMSVSDVLALAGGTNSDGKQNEIQVLHAGGRNAVKILAVSKMEDVQIRSGDQIRVREKNWISRNTALLSASITAAALVFAALIH